MNIYIKTLFVFFTIAGASIANAQKLPNKQAAGLFAPANVKIDGKATEWGDKFQAYNKATELYYTLANDNYNLYLVIQATEPLVMRKIVAGGITFNINNVEKNANNEGVAISYPVYELKNLPNINLRNKPQDVTKLDSFKNVINKELTQKAKEIKLSGIKAIDETLISIYNEYQIKIAGTFNDNIVYTYELALPLKYIMPLINSQSKFNYTITLNGSVRAEGAIIENIEGGTRITSTTKNLPSMIDMQSISTPTNFSGEYIIVKR